MLVSGAAGLGKSRLVAELAARVSAEQGRCVLGTAIELTAAPPFGLWSDVLHELVAEIRPPPADAAWPADLARLCRSVEWRWGRPAAATAAQDPEQERGWLFEAVAEALAWSARDAPLLVILEDLQLADHASIALLAYAGRRFTRLPVLIVATRRLATSREELAIAIDALTRRHVLIAEIMLDPLGAADTTRIVAAAAPGLDRDTQAEVIQAAQGNPLLAREAARAAVEGTDLSRGFRAWVRAPLARLPGSARLLVDASRQPNPAGCVITPPSANCLPDHQAEPTSHRWASRAVRPVLRSRPGIARHAQRSASYGGKTATTPSGWDGQLEPVPPASRLPFR